MVKIHKITKSIDKKIDKTAQEWYNKVIKFRSRKDLTAMYGRDMLKHSTAQHSTAQHSTAQHSTGYFCVKN